MKTISLRDFDGKLLREIIKGVFVYPTDTVYGIGCDAENAKLVEKIRMIKGRDSRAFSVIAPSVDYVLENCEVPGEDGDGRAFLRKFLPGAYTLILKKKNKSFLNSVSEGDTIGMRIPSNSFTKILQKSGKPIVTTSANLTGEKPASSTRELNKSVSESVDFVIDGGKVSGKPSKIVNVISGETIERER